jgi:hypothetical protein
LSIVVCAAGPARAIETFVSLALGRGWTVQVIATPAALEFFERGEPGRTQMPMSGRLGLCGPAQSDASATIGHWIASGE